MTGQPRQTVYWSYYNKTVNDCRGRSFKRHQTQKIKTHLMLMVVFSLHFFSFCLKVTAHLKIVLSLWSKRSFFLPLLLPPHQEPRDAESQQQQSYDESNNRTSRRPWGRTWNQNRTLLFVTKTPLATAWAKRTCVVIYRWLRSNVSLLKRKSIYVS